jgi:hypothetical protein
MKDRVRRVARSQHAKDMFDGETATPDNGLPTENLRVHRNAFEKELLIHGSTSHKPIIAQLRAEENLAHNLNLNLGLSSSL